jgi:hypothetical protein
MLPFEVTARDYYGEVIIHKGLMAKAGLVPVLFLSMLASGLSVNSWMEMRLPKIAETKLSIHF